MIEISNKSQCCGCSACAQICPMHVIQMNADSEGFLYPEVDRDRCIACDRCNEVCPIEISKKNEALDNGCMPKAFGGWHRDEKIRYDSSSGGAFSLFAIAIIKKGGKVFGCTLDEKMKAIHIGIDNIDELSLLRGSKYVQSDINDVYREVKGIVKQGRLVLFVGTPCQAAGLFTYMGSKEIPNLYIVDFICHGVPSPQVFADYVSSEQRKMGSELIKFRFRNKDRGWSQTGFQLGTYLEYADGRYVRKYPALKDNFMNAFLDDVCLRPSCYECNFKCLPKGYTDFTIADFWGVEKVNSRLNDNKGTSLILVHSQKGMNLWNNVNYDFEYEEVDFEKAIRKNPPLVRSSRLYPRREMFYRDYFDKGYAYVEKRYMSPITWGWHKCLYILAKLWNKFGQFIKFGIVGISNTAISLAVYYFGIFIGIHYIFAYMLGYLISVCNAFFWNNKYVFKNKQEKSLIKAFFKVIASYGMSFLLSIILMSFLVEILHISSAIAPILKMAITIPLNFMLNKVWAFKCKKVDISNEI